MPYKDPAAQRAYQREWIANRRAQWLDGRQCVDCGSTDALELDHVIGEKVSHRMWSWSQPRLQAELDKCVVRCADCHHARHAEERRTHGIGGYQRGCRCDTCRAAKAEKNRQYRERRRRDLHPGTRLCRPLRSYSATSPEDGDGTAISMPEAA